MKKKYLLYKIIKILKNIKKFKKIGIKDEKNMKKKYLLFFQKNSLNTECI